MTARNRAAPARIAWMGLLGAESVRCYALDRPQNTPAGLHRYCAKVHSNPWYYVDSTTAPDGSGPVPSREPGEPLTHHTDAPATGGDWHRVACGLTHIAAGRFTSGRDGVTCPDCREAIGLPRKR